MNDSQQTQLQLDQDLTTAPSIKDLKNIFESQGTPKNEFKSVFQEKIDIARLQSSSNQTKNLRSARLENYNAQNFDLPTQQEDVKKIDTSWIQQSNKSTKSQTSQFAQQEQQKTKPQPSQLRHSFTFANNDLKSQELFQNLKGSESNLRKSFIKEEEIVSLQGNFFIQSDKAKLSQIKLEEEERRKFLAELELKDLPELQKQVLRQQYNQQSSKNLGTNKLVAKQIENNQSQAVQEPPHVKASQMILDDPQALILSNPRAQHLTFSESGNKSDLSQQKQQFIIQQYKDKNINEFNVSDQYFQIENLKLELQNQEERSLQQKRKQRVYSSNDQDFNQNLTNSCDQFEEVNLKSNLGESKQQQQASRLELIQRIVKSQEIFITRKKK
eukprot:403377174